MSAMSLRASLLFAAVAVVPACGAGASSEGDGALPSSVHLSDGVDVAISPEGALRLSVGGRVVFATADRARPTTRTFESTASGPTAIWSFSRDDEVATPAGPRVRDDAPPEPDTARVRFGAADGRAAMTVTVRPLRAGASLVTFAPDRPAQSIAVPLACDAASTFYGFGEQYDRPEHRGDAFDLVVQEQGIGRAPDAPARGIAGDAHTTYFPMPYFFDARGFGLLARTASRALVDLCKSDADVAWLEVEQGAPLELVVFHGPTPLDVIRELGDEVGRPKLPPRWAFATAWIGAQGGRDAVLARAAKIEAADLPARVLWVQDWTGPRKNLDGGSGVQYRWVADDATYPDLRGMIADLATRGFRFLGYANPFVVRGLEHFDAMASGGMLVTREDGSVYEHLAPNGSAATPDLTKPETRAYVQRYLRAMIEQLGMSGFMADFGEWAPLDARYGGEPGGVEEHDLYPVRWHGTWREAMDAARPDGDWVVFARSGFTGVQRVAQIYWAGDQEATFSPYDGLPTVPTAMMSLGFAGVPFVTHDVAGFSGGPSTKELYLRWVELGAFSPILRTHDGNKKDENWSWDRDDETLAHFRRMARVHERLAPEIVALAEDAAKTGAPIVRHLVLAYPADETSRRTHDEYLLGERLLVAPVLTDGARSRHVYFPPGGAWFDVWTGARHEGGTTADVEAPIGSPPVFARDADRADLRAP